MLRDAVLAMVESGEKKIRVDMKKVAAEALRIMLRQSAECIALAYLLVAQERLRKL